MFKFIKKIKRLLKRSKLEDSCPAFLKYFVDQDLNIYLEFKWDNSVQEDATKLFSQLLHNSSSGQLIEDVLDFIESECEKSGKEEEFESFMKHLMLDRFSTLENFKDMMAEAKEIEDEFKEEVVVKPTDVARSVVRENRR
tara:strand:+ start:2830 stop:3249 length:420 start_codon:yes stop_codon:yes gene_type:complete